MGRSSRGGGGGRRSFGGGRGRSFGGRSGGSSRSSRASSRGYRSHAYRGSGVRIYYGHSSMLSSVVVCIILLLLMWIWAANRGSITKSTIQREKLEQSACQEIDTWFIDDANWFRDTAEVEHGLKSFYDDTGVQPLLIVREDNSNPSNAEVEQYMNSVYDEYISDEGHLVFMYLDDTYGSYDLFYLVGEAADTVMDEEALDTLMDYIDRYASSDLSDEEMFSTAFSKAGERIMHKTMPMWPIFVFADAGVIIAVFLYKRSKNKLKEAEVAKEILNTPL